MLKVRGYTIDVDYSEELEDYLDQFHRMRVRGNKLQACSPFRYEKNPSFAVNLDNGSWVDSGADDESSRKGSFLSLLAFLREEDQEDTCDYLLEKYLHILDDVDTLKLKLDFGVHAGPTTFKVDDVVPIGNRGSKYLEGRGIHPSVIEVFQIGEKDGAVVIPWHDMRKTIINAKFRSVSSKKFWFLKDGQQIKHNVFGLWLVRQTQAKVVWLVESEIDCLYLWSCGIPSIAFGGASISDIQKKLILKTDIECLVVATDNDLVGHRFADVLKEEFMGIYQVKRLILPVGKKDVNELSPTEIQKCEIKDFQWFKL